MNVNIILRSFCFKPAINVTMHTNSALKESVVNVIIAEVSSCSLKLKEGSKRIKVTKIILGNTLLK